MAGEKLMVTRYFKHSTTAIAGVTNCRIVPGCTEREDQGAAGDLGRAGCLVTNSILAVEVYGTDFAALLALVGAAAANGVIGIKDETGANEKITIKNLYFSQVPNAIDVPDKDSGGRLPTCMIRGGCNWGAADTFATMVLASTDT